MAPVGDAEIPDTGTGSVRSSATLRSASSIVAESVGLASAPIPSASSSGTVEIGMRTPISLVEEPDRTEWDIKERLNLPVKALIESS